MRIVYAQLRGGLGNQLFQYSTARAIALAQNATLVLDPLTGFARDHVYRRKYELHALPINAKLVSFGLTSLFLLNQLIVKSKSKTLLSLSNKYLGLRVEENDFRYDDRLPKVPIKKRLWLVGYWQTPKYFEHLSGLLQRELMPATPAQSLFTSTAELMRNTESVALGVRLYEEATNPEDHALAGRVKSIEDINRVIQRFRHEKPTSRFFVFCTHRAKSLALLDLPADTVFVTGDDGFSDAVDGLWLLSRCKHHIFTNSTYYWWGAWLSHAVHNRDEQLIYAADNFINIDGICDHWRRF